ncbi:uncharacterized protein LOC143453159 isoform X1 [Clavelina lepadiformis]|uniref:uncharacterized protein LOC143453159 isoform X1 n=2 Tax=Clavelina lepadiformis TaxID=159417 RepID=UPI0040423EF7
MFLKVFAVLLMTCVSSVIAFAIVYTCETNARQQYEMFFPVLCPKGCASHTYTIWGNGTYTHDSPICRAAIHDGRITDEGGAVMVYKQPGQMSYVGTERNSITSSSYGYWRGSFSFTPNIPDTPITCETPALDKRFVLLNTYEITCPSGCVSSSAEISGDVIYAYDSAICVAAIHDGALTNDGGKVTVYKQPGQPFYVNVTRNSINSTTSSYTRSSFSFRSDLPDVNDPPFACGITAHDTRFGTQASYNITCPKGCLNDDRTIWGSGFYTHDSSICRAAIHDGVLIDDGGPITFYRQIGQPSHIGIERNSISSSAYGYWRSCFSFTPKAQDPPDCTTTAEDPKFFDASQYEFACSPGCANSTADISGTVVYTSNSSICKAGIHDGRITDADGGWVKVFVQPGQQSYNGTDRNSLTSLQHGPFLSSFSFTKNMTDDGDHSTVTTEKPEKVKNNDDGLYALLIIPIVLLLILAVFVCRKYEPLQKFTSNSSTNLNFPPITTPAAMEEKNNYQVLDN